MLFKKEKGHKKDNETNGSGGVYITPK